MWYLYVVENQTITTRTTYTTLLEDWHFNAISELSVAADSSLLFYKEKIEIH